MKRVLWLLVNLIFLITLMFGQEKNENLYTLIKAAQNNDNLYQIILMEKSKLNLQHERINSGYFPSVNLGVSFKYQSELPLIELPSMGLPVSPIEAGVKDQYDMNIEINELIFNGFTRQSSKKLNKNLNDEQEFKRIYRREEIAHLILQLAYQHHLLQISKNSLITSGERLNISLKRVKLFYEQGFKSALDTLEITGKINDLLLKKVALQTSQNQILIRIRRLTNINSITEIKIPDDFLVIRSISELELNQNSLQENYNIALLKYYKNNLTLTKEIHKSAFYPHIYGFGSFHYGKPGINFMGNDWQDFWIAGISLKFNLWSWNKDKKQIQIDNFNLKQLEYSKLELERNKNIQISQMKEKLSGLKQQLQITENNFLEKKEKYNLTSEQWTAGQKSTIDVLAAEQELTNAELIIKQIKFEYLSLYQKVLFELNKFKWEQN